MFFFLINENKLINLLLILICVILFLFFYSVINWKWSTKSLFFLKSSNITKSFWNSVRIDFFFFFKNTMQLPFELLISLLGSFIAFVYALILWNLYPVASTSFCWVELWFPIIPQLDINFILGADSTSLLMVVFTTFLMPLALLTLIDRKPSEVLWMSICLLLLELFLLTAFLALDIYLFYISFEAVLIPMFFLIGLAGSRARKSKAAFYLFFYTLIGSLCMLISIIFLHTSLWTSRYDIIVTSELFLPLKYEKFYFILFFIAFAIKTPVFPFHLWLPEAHVEAPTTGSIILAGLLLKLGTYGIYRFCILLFPAAGYDLKNYIFSLMIISMFFTSLAALRQTDMKRVVAYSSIVHMSYCVLGLFSFTDIGIKASFVLMVAHGLVSSSLFALVGVLYDRYKTRFISYYGGLAYAMPQTAILFFFAILGNISFPITASFVGELGIFIGFMQNTTAPLLLVAVSLFLSTAFSIFLYNRLFFGALNTKYIKVFKDISTIEFFVNYWFLLPVFFLGVFPVFMLKSLDYNVQFIFYDFIKNKILYFYIWEDFRNFWTYTYQSPQTVCALTFADWSAFTKLGYHYWSNDTLEENLITEEIALNYLKIAMKGSF